MNVVVTQLAAAEMEAIVVETRLRFGDRASRRYLILLRQALRDLSRKTVLEAPDAALSLPEGFGAYHLLRSRANVVPEDRVRSPRHYILFRVDRDQLVVLRVVHDRSHLKGIAEAVDEGENVDDDEA